VTTARILVVDDEADINTVLSVTLRRAGYEVVSAADGVEAVERQAPDLILLDIMMPRRCAASGRTRPPRTCVTLSSGGHPDPVLFRAGGEPAAVDMSAAGGPVLGVFDDSVFEQTALTLEAPGDALILVTDGILEAQDQDGRRPGRAAPRPVLVRERARNPQALARLLAEDVLRRGGSRIQDDMTVFVLRR